MCEKDVVVPSRVYISGSIIFLMLRGTRLSLLSPGVLAICRWLWLTDKCAA